VKIGSHVSFSGNGLKTAATEAIGYGATSFMIYTGAPQNTRRKPMEQQFVPEGLELMQANSIDEIVVHAPYIINLASYKPEVFELAVEFLQSEIMRTDFLGQDGIPIVLHPGAFTDKDVEFGLNRIVEGLNEVLSQPAGVNIALETMAGKGTEIGRSFEEIAEIISRVDNPERLRVCFDTCHVHDSGYDIVNDFDGVLSEFDRLIGLDRIAVFHINDSKNPRGARKDRHAPLGAGHIGYHALAEVVKYGQANGKPVILETPWIGADKKRTRPMYEAEIALLRGNALERFGAEFADDVAQIECLVQAETGAGGREFVLGTWNQLQDRKARLADPREPMQRIHDLIVAADLFPALSEEQINHRIVAYFAS